MGIEGNGGKKESGGRGIDGVGWLGGVLLCFLPGLLTAFPLDEVGEMLEVTLVGDANALSGEGGLRKVPVVGLVIDLEVSVTFLTEAPS